MIINNKILGLLGIAAKSGTIISGADACKEVIQKNKSKLIIVSEDSSEKTKKEFRFLSEKHHVPIIEFGTIEGNSKAIGKQNRAIICVKNTNLANEIYKIFCGGEAVGKN